MHRTLPVPAVIAFSLLVLIAGNAPAALIGMNFIGNDPSGLDEVGSNTAGVEVQTHWNDLKWWEGTTLYNADGNTTGVTVDIGTNDDAYNSRVDVSGMPVPGDNLLMRGYYHGSGTSWTVTFSGLTSEYDSSEYDSYDLIVYFDGANSSSDWTTEYAVSSGGTPLASIFAKDATDTADWDGTFVQATGTSAATATDGNYVRFTGLTADSLTLTATPDSGDAPINGLQLIPAPEPATLALLAAGGALGLARRGRRRR